MPHCLLHQVTQAAVAELILWPQEQQFLVRSRHSTQPARSCPQVENRCYPWQILLLWNPSEIYSRKWRGSKQEQEHWKDKSIRGQVVAWLQLFHCISRALCEDNMSHSFLSFCISLAPTVCFSINLARLLKYRETLNSAVSTREHGLSCPVRGWKQSGTRRKG